MRFLIFNFTVRGGKLQESYFDDVIMKEAAFNSKYGIKGSVMYYTYCLVPYIQLDNDDIDFTMESANILEKIETDDPNVTYSLYKFLKPHHNNKPINQLNFDIDFIRYVDSEQIDIFYTDGSFKKDNNSASYACFKLFESTDIVNATIAFDDFTNKNYSYEKYSNVIQSGTNNIGELTGIRTAAENFGGKSFQLIISDSEYSVKAFREWIYNWKNNGYKTYAKKPIANKDLIESTHNLLTSGTKIIFYKWTKGHANNSFNELCDEEAKKVLGIEK